MNSVSEHSRCFASLPAFRVFLFRSLCMCVCFSVCMVLHACVSLFHHQQLWCSLFYSQDLLRQPATGSVWAGGQHCPGFLQVWPYSPFLSTWQRVLLFFQRAGVGVLPSPPLLGGQVGSQAHQQAACLGCLAGWAEQGMSSMRCGVGMLTPHPVLSSGVRELLRRQGEVRWGREGERVKCKHHCYPQ